MKACFAILKNTRISCAVAMLLSVAAAAQEFPSVSSNKYKLASTSLLFKTTCYDLSTGVMFLNLHENEATSLQAGRHFLSSVQKHCLLELQHSQLRLVRFRHKGRNYSIDPNRVFTRTGARASLKKHSLSYSEEVLTKVNGMASRFTKTFIDDKVLIVALHNNTDSDYSIRTYLSGEDTAAAVFINEEQDADDFFFTTEKNYFDFLQNKGYNVVLQHNKKAADDGSLSIYCAQRKIPYINIEAQDGHLDEQKRMLELLHELIETVSATR